ncbi:hypothetical protein AB0M20_37870, partial [Actinoplanes sp. NPDC051633]|uniref:hypothetical protein n=1 Tax=Actinoplanes sp. NPDC051633 TaxID=3155670 RepID=UPI00342AA22A
MESQTIERIDIDPAELLLDMNVRKDVRFDKDSGGSIAERGVLVTIIACAPHPATSESVTATAARSLPSKRGLVARWPVRRAISRLTSRGHERLRFATSDTPPQSARWRVDGASHQGGDGSLNLSRPQQDGT